MPISDYSTLPESNTAINGIDISEGCAPSGINDAIRQLMADIKLDKETGVVSLEYLGTVSTMGELPAGGAGANAFFHVELSGKDYVYTDGEWTELAADNLAWTIHAAEKPNDALELSAIYARLHDGGFVIFDEE